MMASHSIGLRLLALVTFVFMLLTINSYHDKAAHKIDSNHHIHPQEEGAKRELGMEPYPTGSRLPDCSHACGACSPCKRVMVSSKCSVAESCPIVYRCMCKGKYYHVPSS